MTIIIQGIVFVDVSESFAERIILGMQKSGRPSINKAEAMTEDLSADELKVLDILSERINTDTLQTKPVSLTALVRTVVHKLVQEDIGVISAQEFFAETRKADEGLNLINGRSNSKLMALCWEVAKKMGTKSISRGIWQLPSMNDLTED
jgi:hypothetical protein